MQEEDEAIAQVFYWAGTANEMSDMPSLGTKFFPKEQAIQYGPEALAYWSRWDDLIIRVGIFLQDMVPERWVKADTFDGCSSSRTKENPRTVSFNEDQRRTACNREDVGEDTTTILVADYEDGYPKKSPVVLKLSSTECQGKRKRAAVQP